MKIRLLTTGDKTAYSIVGSDIEKGIDVKEFHFFYLYKTSSEIKKYRTVHKDYTNGRTTLQEFGSKKNAKEAMSEEVLKWFNHHLMLDHDME